MNELDRFNFITNYNPENGGTYEEPQELSEWFTRQHLILEFKSLPFRTRYFYGFLNENNGHINDITHYLDVFRIALVRVVRKTNNLRKLDFVFNKDVYQKTIGETLNDEFLKTVSIYVQYRQPGYHEGSYVIRMHNYNPENHKIEINIDDNDENSGFDKAKRTLGHELIHAYEDWCRRTNGKPGIYNRNYDTIERALRDQSRVNRIVGLLLYLTEPTEVNATIGQILPELESAYGKFISKSDDEESLIKPNNTKGYDVDKALEDLKSTDAYRCYNVVRTYTSNLANIESDDWRKIYVDAFNRIGGFDFNNYGELRKFILDRCDKYTKKFENRAWKCIGELLMNIKEDVIYHSTVFLHDKIFNELI